ncbi:MAG: dTDP-4-dehydrorhamnose reductase [Aliiglaciecola sp.]
MGFTKVNIIVLGKNGQLAHHLGLLSKNIVNLGREDIDILSYDALAKKLDEFEIQGIINASAYTAVDKAETEEKLAYDINTIGVKNISNYAASKKLHLVHVSTDYVFSGDKGSPYLVSDQHRPLGVYGKTKSHGEKAILDVYPTNSCIIRTSWVYSETGKNFVTTMLSLMESKSELSIVDDQIGSPTSAAALAIACYHASINKIVGIHHFTDSGVCSWYDFALAIQDFGLKYGLLNKKIMIHPIPTSAYPTAAKRPSYSVLDKSRLTTDFGISHPKHWRDELEATIVKLTEH